LARSTLQQTMGRAAHPWVRVATCDRSDPQMHASTYRHGLLKAKARQASKIGELKSALIDAGLITLDEQARALGLSRSTAWNILRNAHKASGISARIVIRMLSAPDLPPLVRRKIIEYVLEKIEGAYGHSIKRSREFASRIALAPTIEGVRVAEEIERVRIAKLNTAIVHALADPDLRSQLADFGQEIFPRDQQTPRGTG
jgi:hypothetical protein